VHEAGGQRPRAGPDGVVPSVGGSVPRVTAAVLTYDGRELLEVVLPSLARQRFRDFRVLVVDNGSTDGTEEWMAAAWPDVEVVRLPTNVGVTPALNVCLTAPRTELVLLLNNDMELDPECLGELVRVLDEHPEAGSACPKLLSFHDREVLDGAGDAYSWGGVAWRRGHGERDSGQYDAPRAVFGACGGAALYRRTAVSHVGPFDETFFAVYEDVDWAFRAQITGRSCRYVPSAVAYHMGGATIGDDLNEFVQYQLWRNSIWMVAKNYPLAAVVDHARDVVFIQWMRLKWAIDHKRTRLLLRAWRDAARGMPAVLRKRRIIQRQRLAALQDLERVIGVDDPA
jgi:GT2 family glycosyltransferase